jgi:hypothetical protein
MYGKAVSLLLALTAMMRDCSNHFHSFRASAGLTALLYMNNSFEIHKRHKRNKSNLIVNSTHRRISILDTLKKTGSTI